MTEMNAHERDLMRRALTAYRDRVLHFVIEYVAANGYTTLDDLAPFWEEITRAEAALLGEERPETYLARTLDERGSK